LEHLRLTW